MHETERGAEASSSWCPPADDRAILSLLAGGTTVDSVARRMRMSERTVRRRLHAMAEELGVATTMQVVVRAVRAGLI